MAKEYLDKIECESLVVIPGNHDSRNVGYVHFEELFGPQLGAAASAASRSSRSTRPSPTSTTARSAAAATAGSRSSSPRSRRPADLRAPPPPAAVPGTGRERNIVYDAGDALECLQRAGVDLVLSGHKHVPYAWRLENLFIVNAGTVSSLRLRGNTPPLLQPHRGRRDSHVDVWRKYPFHGQERIIQFSTETLDVREVHRSHRGRGDHAPMTAPSPSSTASTTPPSCATRSTAAVRVRRRLLVGGTEKLRGGEDYGVPLVPISTRRCASCGPTSWSISPTSPCSAPVERFRLASRVLALGIPYVGADFRFDPPELRACSRRRRWRVIGTGQARRQDGRDRLRRRGCSRATALGRGRRDGAGRAGRAGARRVAADASTICSRCRAPGGTPRRTISRRRRSPASSPSAAGAAAAAWPGAVGVSNVAAGAELAAARRPDSSSSTAAAPRSRPLRPARASSSRRAPHDLVTGYLNPYRVLISRPRADDGRAGFGHEDVAARSAMLRDAASSRASCRARWSRSPGGASRSSPPAAGGARPARAHLRRHVPRSSPCPRNLADRDALRRDLRPARRRRLRRRDQGGGDRRRRRGRRRARGPGRVRRQRRRAAPGRADLDELLLAAVQRAAEVRRMTEPRRIMALPLGGEDGLPYSQRAHGARAHRGGRLGRTRVRARAPRSSVDLRRARRATSSTFDRLEALAVEMLGESRGHAAPCRRLRRYARTSASSTLPLVLLVGGATGTGKSTVATEVAYRLGITRVTSTDFVRQTMRAFFSHEFMPAIHYSSFEAGRRACPLADDPLSRASSSRRATCSSASRRRSSARSRRAGRWCSRASTSCPGCCPREEGALVVQCVLAHRGRGSARAALLSPRCGVAERPMREVPRSLRGDPAAPGLPRRARAET